MMEAITFWAAFAFAVYVAVGLCVAFGQAATESHPVRGALTAALWPVLLLGLLLFIAVLILLILMTAVWDWIVTPGNGDEHV